MASKITSFQALRSLHTAPAKAKKMMLITGGKAQMAPTLIASALKRDYEVVACSRQISDSKDMSRLHWVKIHGHEIKDPLFWEYLIQKYGPYAKEIAVVNTIGVAVAPKGSTLEDVNEKPVLAALEALETQQKRTGQKVRFANFSSVCATYYPTDVSEQEKFCAQSQHYCSLRQKVDDRIYTSPVLSTIVRPGFVFTDLRKGRILDTGHAYSPEQFAAMPLHPILGSGDQIQQPVYVNDVIDAVLNGLETDENHLVDAVGPDAMTQKEMFKFFVDLSDKTFRPIEIPYELAEVIARHAPKGRIAPYSVSMFRHLEKEALKKTLCKEKFEKLVGRPLTSISDLYSHLDSETIVMQKPPILEHAKEILKLFFTNPEARKDFTAMAAKYGLPMCVQALKAFLLNK